MMAFSLFAWHYGDSAAQANPTGGTVAQGSASFITSGAQLTVNTSANAYINWQTFNIGAGETTTFVQPSANSVVWNHITDANPSQILGTLNANGYVILQSASGFTVGGSAAINAHGLIMTTSQAAAPDLSSGGAWSFNALPPSAQIVNYGQINIAGGGSAYLIASDIENNGSISASGGQIGLYAGEQVLLSLRPDGRGISTEITLPQGSVDNEGHLTADAGSIAIQAQTVNQNGLVQADSVQNVNGVIELVASDSLNLKSGSDLEAHGDNTAANNVPSAGGSVTLQSAGAFADQAGSVINVSGSTTQGGAGGQVSLSAPTLSALNSSLNGAANSGYAGGSLSINTANIVLNSSGAASPGALALDASTLPGGFSQFNLQASGNLEVSAPLTLPANGAALDSVSLQAGNTLTVDDGAGVTANGGSITLNAPTVNEYGKLQANSVGAANGVIEIDGSSAINLGADASLSAQGDPSASSGSPGGFVVLHAGGNYTDTATSVINVAGQNGGPDGIVEILGNNLTDATSIQSQIDGVSASQFALSDILLVNPYDLTLSYDTTAISSSPDINVSGLAAYSQIDFHTLDNIELTVGWNLNDATTPSSVGLSAGNDLIVDDGAGLTAGNNWNLNFTAGTGFATSGLSAPPSGSYGIYLYGAGFILGQNGNINLSAVNEVQVGWSGQAAQSGHVNSGVGSITTLGGGGITVNTQFGDVNAGADPEGYVYPGNSSAPYYVVATAANTPSGDSLGGISTGDGGNVTINAGGNVISSAPAHSTGVPGDDGGSGAFGPNPGNVTITAGQNVYGHYVLADGLGSITAGQNVGAPNGKPFALSLVDGSWTVNAPNGDIYLQEVRNPNGVFDTQLGTPGFHWFDYAPNASVNLNANGVFLTGTTTSLPRAANANVQVLYPPILDISAGSGGITLDGNLTLFPSVDQQLILTTTDGGSLTAPVTTGNPIALYMSDSAQSAWANNSSFTSGSFSVSDHAANPDNAGNDDPVLISIAGDIQNLDLITSKVTDIHVGGNLYNSGFSGENYHSSDITSITVNGQIINPSTYTTVTLPAPIPTLPLDVLPTGTENAWDSIFDIALNPAIATTPLAVPTGFTPSQYQAWLISNAPYLFSPTIKNGQLSGNNPGFFYTPSTSTLGFTFNNQQISQLQTELASGKITVFVYGPDGVPETQNGYFVTTTVSWADPASVATLLGSAPTSAPNPLGYRIGGPGQFDVSASSISLGNTYGILSTGVQDPQGGFGRYNNLVSETSVGATVNVTVQNDLTMLTSTIATLGGGDVNVNSLSGSLDLGAEGLSNESQQVGYGVFTTGGGNVNVTALDDINIDGSRIATYDGGNVFVESLTGTVNVGSGGNTYSGAQIDFVNPTTGKADYYDEAVVGNGIVAYTLVAPPTGGSLPPGSAEIPGDITVETPQGDIVADQGGITQEALHGDFSGTPSVNLTAGTFPSGTPGSPNYSPGYAGNINLGQAGVIGGNVNVSANGNVEGLIISRDNTTIIATKQVIVTVLAGGQADVSGQAVTGLIVGLGGANVTGDVTADVLGENVSVDGGGPQNTLGTTATASAAAQSAANQSSSQSQQTLASNSSTDDDSKKKKKQPLLQHVKRVTVILGENQPNPPAARPNPLLAATMQ